jgi:hypothetical protein
MSFSRFNAMERRSGAAGWVTGALVLLMQLTAHGQWSTQTLTLAPGWNPVYLGVLPTPSDCDSIFGANPRIVSVRRWAPPPIEAVQYDEVTGAILPQSGSWLTWFPVGHTNRALLNLVEVAGGAAYLIEVSAGSPFILNLQGRPLALSYEWQPGSHHFVGMPAFSPTVSFGTFFAAAGSSILVDYRDGGEVYTVTASGAHQRIFTPNTTPVAPGAAYWIKAQQYSTYAGPTAVKLDSPTGWMDFGSRLVPQHVEIRNVTSATRGVRLALLASGPPPAGTPPLAGPVPLRYAVVSGVSASQGRVWQSLPPSWTTQLAAGASVRLALLPDAAALAAGNTNSAFQSILEVTDDVGIAGVVRQRFGIRAMARLGSAAESRGLWVGEVNLTDVGRLQMPGVFGIPQTPRPVGRPFTFRLLAHVDTNGAARLLQRVFVGTRADPANGGILTELLATEARVSAYRAQHPTAKVFRLSSANLPFMAPASLTNGAFGVPNQTVRGGVEVSRDDPVNPFLHPYAPLHDNKERRAEDDVPYASDVEVFSVRREIEMVFQGPDAVNPEPRWGETVVGGIYRERIYGLGGPLDATNRVITAEGRFVLQRASAVGALQQ